MTAARRPAIKGADVISARPTVASVVVDGRAVIFDELSKTLHTLDPVGSVVWECLDGTGTLAEIEADLAEAYATPITRIRTDVRRLIRQLRDLELIVGAGGVTAAAVGEPSLNPQSASPRVLEEPPNP